MKINLARSSGFCLGVKRALEIAAKTVSSARNTFMLGDVVHNEDVVREIENSGIKKIGRLAGPGKNKVLLIRAHGVSLATFKKAKSLGFRIVDATCPMVKEIHRIAKEMENKNYRIIIIGDKRHEEVRGIVGQLKNKAIVIDKPNPLPLKQLQRTKKAAIVVQSTQDLEKVLIIVNKLKPYVASLKFFNTVCRPTRLKQEEVRAMPLKNDVMIIIGSKSSANTKRLFRISKALNRQSYWVKAKQDIRPDWFKTASSTGVIAGASTPDSTTKSIIEHIRSLTR